MEQSKERRAYPRTPCGIVDMRGQTIRDISEGGLYLEGKVDYKAKSRIPVSLFLPPGDVAVTLEAQVVRRESASPNQKGYGLAFTDKQSGDYRQLQYFIKDQAK